MSFNRKILDIQQAFVDVLEKHFKDLWKQYSNNNLSVNENIGHYLNNSSNVVISTGSSTTTVLFKKIEDLIIDIDEFWSKNSHRLKHAIQESDRLGIIVGDIDAVSDTYAESILHLGLYFDSVYLVEPLSVATQRIKFQPEILEGDQYVLNVYRILSAYLRIREIIEQLPPQQEKLVIIFVPMMGVDWGDKIFNRIFEAATEHTNNLLSRMLGDEIKAPIDFMKKTKHFTLETIENVINNDPTVSSILTESDNFKSYISARNVNRQSKEDEFLRSHFGEAYSYSTIYPDIQSKFLSLESTEIFSTHLAIDVSTNLDKHHFNIYRINSNQECAHRLGLRQEEVAAQALLGGELTWLLPENLSQLKIFRETDTLEGIRELFRSNRRTLQIATPNKRQEAADEMVISVYDAIQKAVQELEDIRTKGTITQSLRIIQVASSLGLGVLTSVFNLPLSVSIPITALIPTWTMQDIYKDGLEAVEKEQEVLEKPAFILLNFAKQKELNRTLPISSDGKLPSSKYGKYPY